MKAIKDLDKKQASTLISLMLLFSGTSSIWFAQPIIFENPVTLCSTIENGHQTTYPCQEIKACNQFYQTHDNDDRNYTSIIDYKASKYSLSLVHQLICKNRKQKFDALFMINSSMYLAYIILFSTIINNPKPVKIVTPVFIIAVILAHTMIIVSDNFEIIKWSLAVAGFTRTVAHTLIIEIHSNYFNSQVFQLASVSINMSFAVYGLIYPVISVAVNGNYIILNLVDLSLLTLCFLMFVSSIYTMQPQNSMKNKLQTKNNLKPLSISYSEISKIFTTPKKMTFITLVLNSIYANFLCSVFYLFADSFQQASEITVALNICSIVGTIICIVIVMKFDLQKSMQVILFIIGFFLSVTIVLPPKIYQTNKTLENTLIAWIVFVQIFVDVIFVQCIVVTQAYLENKFINFVQNFGGFVARIIMLAIPELTYNLKNIYGYDIYFVYGIVAFLLICLNVSVLANDEPLFSQLTSISISHHTVSLIYSFKQTSYQQNDQQIDIEYIELSECNIAKLVQ